MTIDDFIDVQRVNLESIRKLPSFSEHIPLCNKLYLFTMKLIPPISPPLYGMLLQLCHREFLSAATLIGQAQIDDAGACTRRAAEIAKVALAFKFNKDNFLRWVNRDLKVKRWEARLNDQKIPRLTQINYEGIPPDHEILKALRDEFGELSDMHIHFTMEYLASQDWIGAQRTELGYFTAEPIFIELALGRLIDFHLIILSAFDECFGGALQANLEWSSLLSELQRQRAKQLDAIEPKVNALIEQLSSQSSDLGTAE